jgi:hypothetical protein
MLFQGIRRQHIFPWVGGELRIESRDAINIAERCAQRVRDVLLHIHGNAAKDALCRLQDGHQRSLLFLVLINYFLKLYELFGHDGLKPPQFTRTQYTPYDSKYNIHILSYDKRKCTRFQKKM